MDNQPWIHKYVPKTVQDIEGQNDQLNTIKNFLENFKQKRKKALILHGSSGIGKTAIVYALANNLNLEVIEVNASDFRDKKSINRILGNASAQMSLFAKGKVILVDEVDGISGRKDFGAVSAIGTIIAKTSFPIIMTAQNPFDKKFSSLRKKAELVQLNELAYTDIFNILKKICIKESIQFNEMDLKMLARFVGGDCRAAINDLQSLVQGSRKLERKDLDELSERNQTESMLQALVKVFKISDPKIALRAFDNVQENFDQIFLWVDHNMPKEYTKPEELAAAYECISKADVYKGRIRRWQHWRFLVYINQLLTAGVAVAKVEKKKKFVQYEPTKRLLKIWIANQKYAKRKAIAEKIAEVTHTSTKYTLQHTLPYMQVMMKKDKSVKEQFTEEFELDNDEVMWMVS